MSSPLWRPSPQTIAASQLTQFGHWAAQNSSFAGGDYQALWQWSTTQIADLWESVWHFCEVQQQTGYDRVLEHGEQFPGAVWFPGATLNFAENLLRYRDSHPALVGLREGGSRRVWSYAQLAEDVARLAAALRDQGISSGDRVAGMVANTPEAVIAMLACACIGAVWSSCSPDFGSAGVLDRFGQIAPKVLFAVDGYMYNGTAIDCRNNLLEVVAGLPSLQKVVVIPLLDRHPAPPNTERFDTWLAQQPDANLNFSAQPFHHPLLILFSSGTTGKPKCIVHSAGGTLVQHLKEHRLHVDLRREDVLFYFTTCGWMMWNWLISGLASGCTLVLYDGSPFAGKGRRLLDAVDDEGISVFGTSAKYLSALEKAGYKPQQSHRLERLRTILSTGSPLLPEQFDFVYRDIKTDVCLSSISGGTDIVSCFVLGNPNLPVYRGEIQCRGLGMAVDVWNDQGHSILEEKGELVCTKPFPSCPIGFWSDPAGDRFHAAYFERFPGVWTQGDFAELTRHGGVIIHGRSDATLNPGGIRIGTAEIYRQVEKIDSVLESLVIGQDWQDDVRLVLFVVLKPDTHLDEKLKQIICQTIRANTTHRHVPAKILQVSDLPRTRSGKIVELAVRDMVHGRAIKNTEALANPDVLDQFRGRPELQQD